MYDTSTQAHGTATGEPLAGTGVPQTEPVYPSGSDVTTDPATSGLPNPAASVSAEATYTDTGVRGDRS